MELRDVASEDASSSANFDRAQPTCSYLGVEESPANTEKAAGLVPFAVKLKGDLVNRLRELASRRSGDINGVIGELLEAGLEKYPDLAAKADAAPPPAQAMSQPVTLAQKLVAVALGQPGATVVERPVVKPVKPVLLRARLAQTMARKRWWWIRVMPRLCFLH